MCTAFADCIEALPPSITRSISDLRELDAVLSGSLGTITDKLNTLLALLEQPNSNTVKPEHRLLLLKEIAEEARSFRLGGEDKIRVATGTCETVSSCANIAADAQADDAPLSCRDSYLLPIASLFRDGSTQRLR